MVDVRTYNRDAWDSEVEKGNPWTRPVAPEEIAAARAGKWSLLLTPTIPVPASWFPPLGGAAVLCLASGGGQQGPLLAAAGAVVTVLDNSPRQLAQDRLVAERDGLELTTVEGDMANLSAFAEGAFDLIFHPVSNLFVPDVRPVWRECYRVLRPGGTLLAGFSNPLQYIFEMDAMDRGELVVAHRIPYSDTDSLTAEQRERFEAEKLPLEFGHSLQDQIGGQIESGFAVTGFYEDIHPGTALEKIIPTFIATRAVKPVQ